jgi:hypothetical protein
VPVYCGVACHDIDTALGKLSDDFHRRYRNRLRRSRRHLFTSPSGDSPSLRSYRVLSTTRVGRLSWRPLSFVGNVLAFRTSLVPFDHGRVIRGQYRQNAPLAGQDREAGTFDVAFALDFKVGRSLRPLSDLERKVVARNIVDYLQLSNWVIERGPRSQHVTGSTGRSGRTKGVCSQNRRPTKHVGECPLCPQKQTLNHRRGMSAKGPANRK